MYDAHAGRAQGARGRPTATASTTCIAEVRIDPFEAPGRVHRAGRPLHATSPTVEQAAIGVFLARTVPSGDGNELDNLKLLRGAGRKALDALVPIRQKRETYTIVPRGGDLQEPARPHRASTSAQPSTRSLKASAKLGPAVARRPRAAARAASQPGLLGHKGGSSMFACATRRPSTPSSSTARSSATRVPELFVEYELHYPGVDLRGVSAAGVPVMGIGHNDHVAWGFTSGLTDEDDLYAE